MFDSPFELCFRCGEIVLLDQTQVECTREHHCDTQLPCPMQKLFTGIDFGKHKKQGETR